MNPTARNTILILAAAALVGIIVLLYPHDRTTTPPSIATSTPSATTTAQSISDGTIAFWYSSDEFGLAVTPEQILDHSYIPPCSDDFDYCFYYIGSDYNGTNFESAGLRVEKRSDLTTKDQ